MTQALSERRPTAPFPMVPADADKHARYRLGKFGRWLEDSGRSWREPSLAAYRDHLLSEGLAPSSVRTLLATVRGRYRQVLKDNAVRSALYGWARDALRAQGVDETPAELKATVDEVVSRLENEIDPETARVPVVEVQDEADSDHLRLTVTEASALLAAPGVDTLRGLRDTAIIALLLATGIREAELVGLDVEDLRQSLGGELSLRVREGKGRKARLVPYGPNDWALAIVEAYLGAFGIEGGPVFRGYYRGFQTQRSNRLSTRQVQNIVGGYPITVRGRPTTVRPHDLRRTYARLLFEAGTDLVTIQQNLGHAQTKTTLGYIGTLDGSARRPAASVAQFDIGRLRDVPQQGRLSEDDGGEA